MNSYSFRINVMNNGVEIQSLKEYSDFLYCLKNLKKMRKDASLDSGYNIQKGTKNTWFPLVLCANWGSPYKYQEARKLFNYITDLNYTKNFYIESILERDHWRANGKRDVYCTVHYKADMCMDDVIKEILKLWTLIADFKE